MKKQPKKKAAKAKRDATKPASKEASPEMKAAEAAVADAAANAVEEQAAPEEEVFEESEVSAEFEPFTESDAALEEAEPSEGEAGQTQAEEALTEEEVEALIAERDELQDLLLRTRAEFDNFRKRVAREAERVRKTAAQSLVHDLLPVVDNLERALDHASDDSGGFAQGVEMVFKQMCDILGRNGLEPIPAVGRPFDPNVHEAVMRAASEEIPADHVAQEFQRGYRLGAYVLRPSKVVVSAGAPETPGAECEDDAKSQEA